jgi:hypothetical protein
MVLKFVALKEFLSCAATELIILKKHHSTIKESMNQSINQSINYYSNAVHALGKWAN